ncbi:P22 phage major capsid protein family protein [Denitrobaculum tricleocarpae]|uniref:P22 coat-protein 5 family protein n=1 Tax=Denitrobaculum tricleocarpae TaxID=2591009 RepID=A0A545TSX2_9PROT|nr:P22 phage major capsid protein family protein [Denitrobaculum tricleocarpae]TQV80323.1 hypothetical protein FKG95_09005 [Denitrobaculum tricleocarpae]
MPNSILTPTAVTREALAVLHQKCNFIGTINRQYDDRFAKTGAKIGDTLNIRLPNEYVVGDGPVITTQDTEETSVALQVNNQKHVALSFTAVDLTLSLQDFSKRILEPAMAVLAANIEADAISMYKDVYNTVYAGANPLAFSNVLQGRKLLTDNLAPNSQRTANLNTQDNVDLVDALKGLFNDTATISKQYKEGMMGRTAGFDFYENTLWPRHQSGSAAATTGYLVNGAAQTGSSINIDTGSTSLLKGDVITIANVFRVHPETKATTNVLQQFVVTADRTGAGALQVSPAIVTDGGRQNVDAGPADNAAISKVNGVANSAAETSLQYHQDAFTFATADLQMPDGVDWSAREVYDGISMRIIRDYTITNDQFPCRVDVLYGYKALRPQHAVRLHSNQ